VICFEQCALAFLLTALAGILSVYGLIAGMVVMAMSLWLFM
jgi:hypothetical protein